MQLIQQSWVEWGETGELPWRLLHPEVEVKDHDILDAGEYRGRTGVERWLEDWSAAWSEFSMEPEEFIDAGDQVVAVIRMRATGRGSSAAVERQDALVYWMADGKVVRMDYYNSRAQALAAVGLAGES